MVFFDFGDSLLIDTPVSMPMTIMMVGREAGIQLSNRELFTSQGWRLANNGNWSLLPWGINNPNILSSSSSSLLSLVEWAIKRYEYSIRVNGKTVGTSSNANWYPDVLFDRINGNDKLMIGELLFVPRTLFSGEREKLEGYFSHKWGLSELLPVTHTYKTLPPQNGEGLNLSGIPQIEGNYTVNVVGSNIWGSVESNITVIVNSIPPEIQTLKPLQVGSTSANLQADLLQTGGATTQYSFEFGKNASALDQNTSFSEANSSRIVSYLLTGLEPGTKYFYRAWAQNSSGMSRGDAISDSPIFDWPLDSLSSGKFIDMVGNSFGSIGGDVALFNDPIRGMVAEFDGEDDFISFGDLDELDTPSSFTVSLWFYKTHDNSGKSTNHGIDNVLIAQSSALSNDNFEIGTQGNMIEIYVDSGLSGDLDSSVSVQANDLSLNQWHHLALVYGSEMSLFLDGKRLQHGLNIMEG